jgi:hypothetical protein
VTERFTRKDFGRMDLEVTIDHPKTYTRPWSTTQSLAFQPDTELLEYICNENNEYFEIIPRIEGPRSQGSGPGSKMSRTAGPGRHWALYNPGRPSPVHGRVRTHDEFMKMVSATWPALLDGASKRDVAEAALQMDIDLATTKSPP